MIIASPCSHFGRVRHEAREKRLVLFGDQPEFASFRPGVARAIAQARDEKQRADHPVLEAPMVVEDDLRERLEAIAAVTLASSDVACIVLAARV